MPFTFFAKSFPRSLKVYLPVFAIAFVMSPKRNLLNTLENVARSSFFLSLYCTLAWVSACFYNQLIKPSNELASRRTLFMHTWLAGLATVLERPGRQVRPGRLMGKDTFALVS